MVKYELISFVLSGSKRLKSGKTLSPSSEQSAPHYFSSSIPRQSIVDNTSTQIDGQKLDVSVKSYGGSILLIEARLPVDNPFSTETFDLRDKLIDALNAIAKKQGAIYEFSEEYSIVVISDYESAPEKFLDKSDKIAGFLKSEKIKLDKREIEHTLSHQIKYADNDLIIIDWDGAFIFEPQGKAESIIELLQIANLQLLRYRMLENELSDRLDAITKQVKEPADFWTMLTNRKKIMKSFQDVIAIRAKSIKDFELIEKEIKLIGDWYFARLYDLVYRKFKLAEWKEDIKEKLDNIEDIYSIIEDNFSISRNEFLELIQIILFFFLQLGWFVLIILEFIYFTK